jgi:hypothetical protein
MSIRPRTGPDWPRCRTFQPKSCDAVPLKRARALFRSVAMAAICTANGKHPVVNRGTVIGGYHFGSLRWVGIANLGGSMRRLVMFFSGEIAQRVTEDKRRPSGGPAELTNVITFAPHEDPQSVWTLGEVRVPAIRSTHMPGPCLLSRGYPRRQCGHRWRRRKR